MLLDIKPTKSNANCYANNLIIQVCNYYHRDYLPFFLRYFNDCLSAKNLKNDLLSADPSISLTPKYPYDNLVGFSYIREYGISDNKRFIVSQLESGVPVGLCIDGEHLHWSMSDKSVNRMILVIGYDEKDNIYICADGYLNSQYQYLNEDEMRNNSAVLKLSFKNDFVIESSNLSEAILFGYTNDILEKRKNEMTGYNDYIISKYLIAVEHLQYKEIKITPYIYNLSHFVSNRNSFYDALIFINKKYGVAMPDNVMQAVVALSEKWNIYKNLMVKCAITKSKSILSKAGILFFDIIDLESVVINKIMQYKNSWGD